MMTWEGVRLFLYGCVTGVLCVQFWEWLRFRSMLRRSPKHRKVWRDALEREKFEKATS